MSPAGGGAVNHWAMLRALNEQQAADLGVRRRRAQGRVQRAQARVAVYPGNPTAQAQLHDAESDFDRQHHALLGAHANLAHDDQRIENARLSAERLRIRAGLDAHRQQQRRTQGYVSALRGLLPHPALEAGQSASDWAASLPTPGGLWPVIAMIILFNLAIVPVGQRGETRLYLIWQAFTGASALKTTVNDPAAQQAFILQVTDAAVQQATGLQPAATNSAIQAATTGFAAGAFGVNGINVVDYLRGLGQGY